MNHGSMNHGSMNHGSMNHGSMNPGSRIQDPGSWILDPGPSKKYKKLENVTKWTNIQRNRTKFGQFGARRVRGTCLEGSRTPKKFKKGQILGFWGQGGDPFRCF